MKKLSLLVILSLCVIFLISLNFIQIKDPKTVIATDIIPIETAQQTEDIQPVTTTQAPTTEQPTVAVTTVMPQPLHDALEKAIALNADVIGWVELPNTKINYPVAQSDDNDFYLHRDLNKKDSEPGTIFMDFRNDGLFNNPHTILYGHNMKNGTMFATLKLYKKESFYRENRFFTYQTPYGATKWEIFAAYVSPPTLDLIPTDFKDDADFLNFVDERQKESKYPKDIDIKATDKVLTLITCSYEFHDARFVVHARQVTE